MNVPIGRRGFIAGMVALAAVGIRRAKAEPPRFVRHLGEHFRDAEMDLSGADCIAFDGCRFERCTITLDCRTDLIEFNNCWIEEVRFVGVFDMRCSQPHEKANLVFRRCAGPATEIADSDWCIIGPCEAVS